MYLPFMLIFLTQSVQCARILGVFFMPGYSHYVLGETILKELAARGHDVTIISGLPKKENLKNYEVVHLQDLSEFMKGFHANMTILEFLNKPVLSSIIETHMFGNVVTEMALKSENFQHILKSKREFDVIILEQFVNEAMFGLGHHFKAPLILLGTTSPSLWTNVPMGNPTPFSYVPSIHLDYSPYMNLWERAHNTFISMFEYLFLHLWVYPRQDKLLQRFFPEPPPLEDVLYNASLILLNSHPTFGAAVPLQPNMIQIGGFHVRNHKPLPESLKTFLDEAKEGVIYFSLGSNMQSRFLPKEKVQGILNAFSELKMKVLWKWEDDELPGKPANVRIEKWLPQPAVLAHKNVKAFVTHGGRLSITESIYFGKPIVGIPCFAEQRFNMREAAYFGYGIHLSYDDLGEEHLSKAITEIIGNPRYTEMAKYRSNALHGLPISPLDNAINWIEYVIKTNGAPHLKNAGLRLKWYQYLLLDVGLFVLLSLWLLKKTLCYLWSITFKSKREKVKTN